MPNRIVLASTLSLSSGAVTALAMSSATGFCIHTGIAVCGVPNNGSGWWRDLVLNALSIAVFCTICVVSMAIARRQNPKSGAIFGALFLGAAALADSIRLAISPSDESAIDSILEFMVFALGVAWGAIFGSVVGYFVQRRVA